MGYNERVSKGVKGKARNAGYIPDFLVQYADGTIAIHEIKNPKLIDSEEVKLKRRAAELWCKRRGMEYKIVSIRA